MSEPMAPGRSFEVAPGVVRIVAPNPGIMTGPGTNTYLIGTGDLALIDPGPDHDDHLVALCEGVGDRLKWILVTHTHIDHSPLSARLRAATGAEVVAFGPAPPPSVLPPSWAGHAAGGGSSASGAPAASGPADPAGPGASGPAASGGPGGGASGGDSDAEPGSEPGSEGAPARPLDPHDQDFAPDRLMVDGERLDAGDFAIDAVYTPGHASNHLCFELVGTGMLFSGDHVMNGSTVVIAPPDGDMAVYLESLEKVRLRAPRRIAPGHGEVIEDPAAVLDGYLRHRLERETQVLAGLRAASAEGVTAEQLVESLYREVPKELHPVARYSVWAHLRKLRDDGRAACPDHADPTAPWRLSGG